jgi:hypothetical protein
MDGWWWLSETVDKLDIEARSFFDAQEECFFVDSDLLRCLAELCGIELFVIFLFCFPDD